MERERPPLLVLPENERQQVELAALQDDDAFAQLLAEEDEWLEGYTSGSLQPEAATQLEHLLAASPRLQERSSFFTALHVRAHRGQAKANRFAVPVWLSAAAAVALTALGLTYFLPRLQPQAPVATAAPRDAPLLHQADRAFLPLGTSRGTGSIPVLTLPQKGSLDLSLEVGNEPYATFRLKISDATGRTVASFDALAPRATRGTRVVSLALPKLPSGRYILTLQGVRSERSTLVAYREVEVENAGKP